LRNVIAIDPDDYLDLSRPEPFTREEVRAAWEQAYADLERALSSSPVRSRLFIVFGIQAGGKSAWVSSALAGAEAGDIFFSGPLPSRGHRARSVALGRHYGAHLVAVWICTPLDVCIARNAQRRGLARVADDVIRHVDESLEPPLPDEGFDEIIRVNGAAGGVPAAAG